jgi:hypothetical protein
MSGAFRKPSWALVTLLMALPERSFGQTTTTPTQTADTVLDNTPFVSARAAAMGGALSTVADDLDALYYTPAMIGGLGYEGKSQNASVWRGVYFPYVGVSENQNASKTRQELSASGAQSDAGAGAAVMDANSGKRQYARASFIPIGLIFGRLAIAPVIDQQLAAVSVADSPGDVNMRYRTFNGLMVGTSVADNQNRLSLGVSQAIGTIEETNGTFQYLDMVDVDERKSILSDNRKTYEAKSTNVGITVRIPKSLTPSFSVTARNMGNTKNIAKSTGDDPLEYPEDLTAGVSISPEIGKIGRLNVAIEAGYLTQKEMASVKKFRGGVELLLFGDDAHSVLGLRAGGNAAGASYGAHLNLGLIGAGFESHAVDIGINNERVIERRQSAVVFINVAP